MWSPHEILVSFGWHKNHDSAQQIYDGESWNEWSLRTPDKASDGQGDIVYEDNM